MKVNYRDGDIFSFPIGNNKFAFGRVVLDMFRQGVEKKVLNKSSHLYMGEGIILVEVYQEIEDNVEDKPNKLNVKAPGIYIADGFLKGGLWKILDNKPIDYTKIMIPEFLSHSGAFNSVFDMGEIRINVPIPFKKTEEFNLYPTIHPGLSLDEFLDPKNKRLSKYDVKYSKHKDWIYSHLDIDKNKSYYELSKQKGFDLARFYE